MAGLTAQVNALQRKVNQVNHSKGNLETNMSRIYDAAHAKVSELDGQLSDARREGSAT